MRATRRRIVPPPPFCVARWLADCSLKKSPPTLRAGASSSDPGGVDSRSDGSWRVTVIGAPPEEADAGGTEDRCGASSRDNADGFQDERANARRLPLQNHLTGKSAGPTGG